MFAADIGFTALIDDPTDVNVAKMAVSIALIGEKNLREGAYGGFIEYNSRSRFGGLVSRFA